MDSNLRWAWGWKTGGRSTPGTRWPAASTTCSELRGDLKHPQNLSRKSRLHWPGKCKNSFFLKKSKHVQPQNFLKNSNLIEQAKKICKSNFHFPARTCTKVHSRLLLLIFDFLTISCRVYNSLSKGPLSFMVHIKSSDLSFFDPFLFIND